MSFLVDTCVLSELRRPQPDANVVARLTAIPDDELFISAITLGELVNGIVRLAPGRRRIELEQWLADLERQHSARILPVDAEVARTWGTLTARAAGRGRVVPATDGLIAATAVRHGLQVPTRNTADFRETGASLVDPWQP